MFRCEMLFNRTIISFSRKHVNIFTVLILIFGVSPPNNPSSPAGFHRFDENGGLSHCKRERPPADRDAPQSGPAAEPQRKRGRRGSGGEDSRTPLRSFGARMPPLLSREARAFPQRFEHCVGDTANLVVGQVRMDRQAEHLFAERLAEGERPPPQSETGERPLKMERLWIIDGARNPPNAQVQLHPVALHPVGQADGVLRPRGLGLRRDDGGLDRPGKALGVEGGDFPPPGKLSVKDLELFKQDGGLQRIEARIQPRIRWSYFSIPRPCRRSESSSSARRERLVKTAPPSP